MDMSYCMKIEGIELEESVEILIVKKNNTKEIFNLDVSLIEMVIITLLVVIDIAIWEQLCC